MSTIRKTITLSDKQDAWIKSQIARGAFTNDSEYIRDLLRRDQEAQDKLANLRSAIAEGLDSGVSARSLDEIWAEGEKRARASDA
ncbi:type II toxin-antitoxin system ParD family antitoxin [Aurantiacibacter flavus]|uniref:Type II toxin-antitoxin system ParD family antitoxin n=1 Tax=Aurantiacibacter flavus TaxID=3145232 RepID=A0ABV0CXJ6_9SPHN